VYNIHDVDIRYYLRLSLSGTNREMMYEPMVRVRKE